MAKTTNATSMQERKSELSLLGNLKLVATANTPATTTDPIMMRRQAIVMKLQDQLELLNNPNYHKVLKHRGKEDTEHRVQPWWKDQQDGSVIFNLKSGFKAIEIAKGMFGIHVPRLDQLPDTIQTLIAAVKAGELDEALKKAAEASPVRGRAAAKKKWFVSRICGRRLALVVFQAHGTRRFL
jgi:hypothetical protein